MIGTLAQRAGRSLAAQLVGVVQLRQPAAASPAVGDDRRSRLDMVPSRTGAATLPQRRPAARSGTVPSRSDPGPRPRLPPGPCSRGPGHRSSPTPPRQCTPRPPPPGRSTAPVPDEPARTASAAEVPKLSGRSRSQASASGSVPRFHPRRLRNASRPRTTPSTACECGRRSCQRSPKCGHRTRSTSGEHRRVSMGLCGRKLGT